MLGASSITFTFEIIHSNCLIAAMDLFVMGLFNFLAVCNEPLEGVNDWKAIAGVVFGSVNVFVPHTHLVYLRNLSVFQT